MAICSAFQFLEGGEPPPPPLITALSHELPAKTSKYSKAKSNAAMKKC